MTNFNHLDLNLLRVFESMMRERSVSLAADRLNITQPAVSNALNRLRAAFGDPLFVRTRHGMEPTPLASSLADSIQNGLAILRAGVSQNMDFDPLTAQRRFTIIATDVGEITYIAPLLQILHDEAPNIDLRIMEASREEYESLLDSGEADFALGRLQVAESFRQEYISECIYVAALCEKKAKELGLKTRDVIAYDDYMSLPHVHVVPRGAGVRTNPIEPALGEDARHRRLALTIPHTSVLPELIPGTSLVAAIPLPAAIALCSRCDLVWVYLPFETEITRIKMIWHKRQDGDKGHVWMREKLRSIEFRT